MALVDARIDESGCHEGNYSMRNSLSGIPPGRRGSAEAGEVIARLRLSQGWRSRVRASSKDDEHETDCQANQSSHPRDTKPARPDRLFRQTRGIKDPELLANLPPLEVRSYRRVQLLGEKSLGPFLECFISNQIRLGQRTSAAFRPQRLQIFFLSEDCSHLHLESREGARG